MQNTDTETQPTAQESSFLLTGDMTALVDSTSMDSTASIDPALSYADELAVTEGVRGSMSLIINNDEENRDLNAENAKKARGYLKQYLLATSPEDRESFVKKIIQTKDAETISEAFDETPYTPGNPISKMLINALIDLKAYTALVENFAYMTRGTDDFNLVVDTIAKNGSANEIGELIQLVTARTPEDTVLIRALEKRGLTFDQWMEETRARAKAKHF